MTGLGDTAELLTVDCGNTTLDCLRHADGARLRLAHAASTPSELRGFVLDRGIRRCVASTVVRDGLASLTALLTECRVPVHVAGVDLACPLPLDYDTPATLGSDRWLGALAAHRRFGCSIVADCGSATTVNLVEGDGTFRGGPIGPGLRALVDGMHGATPALPPPRFGEVPRLPPRTTQTAVDSGILLGYAGLVERLVAGMHRIARGPATIVVTGGNGELLLRCTRLRAEFVPTLVHDGLRALANECPCKS